MLFLKSSCIQLKEFYLELYSGVKITLKQRCILQSSRNDIDLLTRTLFQAWRESRTGHPFIDAIMTQLREQGWIHHLARHAVACYLTRGDLWISWERGQEVFEELLLDADWSLNAGNWMWLSASAFFHQYYRVYSPVRLTTVSP